MLKCVSLRKVVVLNKMNMKFSKFIRIVTGGGTRSEIYSIFDAFLDYNKKSFNYDFWKEHIR